MKERVVQECEYDWIGQLPELYFPFLHPKLDLLSVSLPSLQKKFYQEMMVEFLHEEVVFSYEMTSCLSQKWIGILPCFVIPDNSPAIHRPSHALSCTLNEKASDHITNKYTTVFNLPVSTTQGLEAKVESPGRIEALVDSSKYLGWQSGGYKMKMNIEHIKKEKFTVISSQ